MNTDNTHRVQDLIAGGFPKSQESSCPKTLRDLTLPNLDQEITLINTKNLNGPIIQIRSFCSVETEVCLEWFGEVNSRMGKK